MYGQERTVRVSRITALVMSFMLCIGLMSTVGTLSAQAFSLNFDDVEAPKNLADLGWTAEALGGSKGYSAKVVQDEDNPSNNIAQLTSGAEVDGLYHCTIPVGMVINGYMEVSYRVKYSGEDRDRIVGNMISLNGSSGFDVRILDNKLIVAGTTCEDSDLRPNKWYDVKMLFNQEEQTFKAFVDGEDVSGGEKKMSTLFGNSATNIIYFRVMSRTTNVENLSVISFDNLYVDQITADYFEADGVVQPGEEQEEAISFTDLDGHWAQDDIYELAKKGYLQGRGDGIFDPEGLVSVAEISEMMAKALALPKQAYNGFLQDVSGEEWFANSLQAVYNSNIIGSNLLLGGKIEPNRPINREEMASILVRSFRVSYGGVQIAGLGAPYEDIGQAEEWTRTYIDQAYELGLMQGVSGTVFEPKSNLTRAQAATTLARFLKAIEPNVLTPPPTADENRGAPDIKDAYSYAPAHYFGALERNDSVTIQPDDTIPIRTKNFEYYTRTLVEEEGKRKTRLQLKSNLDNVICEVRINNFVREPEYVSYRIRNDSPQPLQFGMKIHEQPVGFMGNNAQILSWNLKETHKLQPGEEKELRFSLDESNLICSDPNAAATKPAYSVSAIPGLLIKGVKQGVPYDLVLSDDMAYFGYAEGMQVESIESADNWNTGEMTEITVNAKGLSQGKNVDLEVRRDKRTMWRIRLTEDEKDALNRGSAKILREIPWYLATGDYSVGLVLGGYRVEGPEWNVHIKCNSCQGEAKAERRMYNGRPTVFVNGEPLPFFTYSCSVYSPGNVGMFGKAGVNPVGVEVPAGSHLSKLWEDTLVAPDTYDYSSVDELVGIALQENPDAYIMLRTYPTMPSWWWQENPDEQAMIMTNDGRVVPWEENGMPAPSLASDKWLEAQVETIRDLIDYVKSQPWGSRVIGLHVTGGATMEWFAWGSMTGGDVGADFNPQNQAKFKQWLIDNGYEVDTDNPVPGLQERLGNGGDILPDDEKSVIAAAYSKYYSDLLESVLNRFARVIKEETDGNYLVGTFYGYLLQESGGSRQALCYSLAELGDILENPDIDYVGGVPLHNYRSLDGYDTFTTVNESVFANGKLYYNENDLFSWLHPLHWNTPYDPNDPKGGAFKMHQRVMANDAVHGALGGWFSLSDSWHNDEDLMKEFQREMDVYAQTYELDRSPTEEVAVVVDDSSFTWVAANSKMTGQNNTVLTYETAKTGVPIGTWLLSDIDKIPDRVKMIIVGTSYAAEPESLEKLQQVIEKGGRTIVVVGPTGYIDIKNGTRDASRPGEILGLPITVNADSSVLTTDELCTPDGEIVVQQSYSPQPRAEYNGEGILYYGDGPAAAGGRDLANGGRLIWCGTAPTSRKLLKQWMQDAGVHFYAPEGYTMYATKELVSISADTLTTGTQNIYFPYPVEVTDLLDGFTAQGQIISCPFEAGQTRLLKVKRLD